MYTKIYVIMIAAFITFVLSIKAIVSVSTLDSVTITPTRVFEKFSGGEDGSTTYMMDAKTPYGEYVEYKLDDNIIFLHFDSGRLKNQLHDNIGNEITCRTTGWRVPFLSMYENIHKCEFN